MTPSDQAALVTERRKNSFDWLNQNFYDQWRKVHRLYKCEVDQAKDDNDPNKIDTTQTRIGMPDTWSLVQRQVARYTAQIPNLKFRADDIELANKISRKCMYDWDRGGTQRDQKRHVAQGCLFGISVRAWSWDTIEYPRMRRVDPLGPLDDGTRKAIGEQYSDSLSGYQQEDPTLDPTGQLAMARLLGDHSRGKLLPLTVNQKKYEGPRSDVLFIGDCFFEPNFRTIQKSNWFIVERRRNKAWIKAMGLRYEQLIPGLTDLLKKYPKGTPARSQSGDMQDLRVSMMRDIDRTDTNRLGDSQSQAAEWTITEMWTPGEECKVCFVGEDNTWIGEVEKPYDLDGKIPFTELVLIDDILSGVGDSHARIIRGLNELHNKNNNQRSTLIDAILKPFYVTNDRDLIDNPEGVTRGNGLRLIFSRNPNALTGIGEQAAIASVIAGMKDEEGILRMIQMGTGEGNLSQAANVDPQQGRTATGARLLAFNQDVLTKSATDMLNLSLNADAEMIYLLNRSEMPESVKFDAAQYSRSYDSSAPIPAQQPMEVSPLDFQIDGEIEAEVGSTLADDDEGELVKAQNLYAMAIQSPDLFNRQKARDNLLIRFGYGRELNQWAAPPPPPPPPPEPPKITVSVPMKFETLTPDLQVSVLQKVGFPVPPELIAQAQQMQAGAPTSPEEAPAPPPSGPSPAPMVAPHGPRPAAPPPISRAIPTALQAAEGARLNGPPQ